PEKQMSQNLSLKPSPPLPLLLPLLLLLLAAPRLSAGQDPVGCGGFVRLPQGAKAPNYARMRVQLYNERGNLRFVSDISPNGAYSVPVYERGQHTIRLSAPDGWHLEPENHQVAVLDQDSCQRDLDFRLLGYAIYGSVHTRGLRTGPPDLPLALIDRRSGSKLAANSTDADGKFVFVRVPPGQYTVRPDLPAGGGAAAFEKDHLDVDVANDNAKPAEALVVKGFAVSAGLADVGAGAQLYLYGALADGVKCEKPGKPHPEFRSPLPPTERPLCRAVTGADGVGRFVDVPGGEYTLVPFHPDYRIEPDRLSLRVRHADLHMGSVFKATGVVLRGRVVGPDGAALSGAHVRLVEPQGSSSSSIETDTGADGRFLLHCPERRSSWTVQVTYPDMLFLPGRTDSLAFSTDIRPDKFRVCGRAEGLGVRPVTSLSAPDIEASDTEQDGTFCIYLTAGRHVLRCGRAQREITVSGPTTGLLLKEQRVEVNGKVVGCPGGQCPADLQVTLSGEETSTAPVTANGAFSLPGQLPGTYTATLAGGDLLCWASRQLQVTDLSNKPKTLEFRVTGFKAFVSSSHDLELSYSPAAGAKPNTIRVAQGRTEICLDSPATPPLQLRAASCHRLAADTAKLERPGDSVSFSAAAFLVRLAADYPDIGGGSGEPVRIDLTADGKPAGQFNLKPPAKSQEPPVAFADMHYPAGAVLEARILANNSVLEPATAGLTVMDPLSCQPQTLRFTVRRGQRIFGQVEPPLSGVEVSLQLAGGASESEGEVEAVASLTTGPDGRFEFGPVLADRAYQLAGRLTGYRFEERPCKRPDERRTLRAHRLAGVHVQTGLPSVLVSMSGDSSRFHQATDSAGLAVFSDLMPGRYYVRGMVKEFRFEPASAEVMVKEGEVTEVALRPVRTGYSAYGRVVSLSGAPLADIAVTGVPDPACQQGTETADTDAGGEFRLRGLASGCRYNVSVRPGQPAVDRTLPPSESVTVAAADATGLVFYGLPRPGHTDLFVTVSANNREQRQSLHLTVHPELSPGRLTDACDLADRILMYSSAVPNDNQQYVVTLHSRLPRHLYSFGTEERRFLSNGSAVNLHFDFAATRRLSEREISTGSFLLIPFTALVLLLAHHRDLIGPAVAAALSGLLSRLRAAAGGGGGGDSPKRSSAGGSSGGDGGSGGGGRADPLSDVPKELLEPSRAQQQQQKPLYYINRRKKQGGGHS
ncbi:hypothetical protein BOX15_Mlig034077g1, partial [Macrostomum lignano]